MDKMKTGDIYEVADVVRNLSYNRGKEKKYANSKRIEC